MVRAGFKDLCPPPITFHSFDDIGKIASLDHKDEFVDDLDAPPVITGYLHTAYVTGTQEILLNQFPQIVCPIQQHGMRFGHTLPNMLLHALSE
jgi:hypothetical protein